MNGGPAFPASSWTKDGDFIGDNQGMTLRDYFAAKALQGMIAGDIGSMTEPEDATTVAQAAYFVADAMLKERSK